MSRSSLTVLVRLTHVGPVKSAQLNYNAEGKSKGVATVIFHKAGDAAKAFAEYNNRTLDNRPMKVELIVNPESANFKAVPAPTAPRRGGIQKAGG